MGTVSIVFRNEKVNKEGLAPIAIKIYDSLTGKRKQEFTGIRVAPKHWDPNNLRVSPSHPNSTRFNKLITQRFNEAYKTLLEVEEKADKVNPFATGDQENDGGQLNFFVYGESVMNELQGSDSSYAKFEKVQGALSRLRRFLEFLKKEEIPLEQGKKTENKWIKRTCLEFADFNYTFIDSFDKFLNQELGFKAATMKASLTGIRTVFNHAIKHKKVDPKWKAFGEFKNTGEGSKIDFLSKRHLEKLRRLDLEPGSFEEVSRDMYLFCALGGGFRWGDIARMRWSRIEGNEIYFKTGKGNADIAFAIPDKAMFILDKYRTANSQFSDFIFPMVNPEAMQKSHKQQRQHISNKNNKVNKVLRSFQAHLGIDWNLTFHSSRHTFATMAIRNGMPAEVLQMILGHSDVSITMQYVHITGEKVREEMVKLNRRMNGGGGRVDEVATPRPISMSDLMRRFVEQTAGEMGVELVGVDELALEMYELMLGLPKGRQRTVPVRVVVSGDSSGFEEVLRKRSLFGDGVRFVVEAA